MICLVLVLAGVLVLLLPHLLLPSSVLSNCSQYFVGFSVLSPWGHISPHYSSAVTHLVFLDLSLVLFNGISI